MWKGKVWPLGQIFVKKWIGYYGGGSLFIMVKINIMEWVQVPKKIFTFNFISKYPIFGFLCNLLTIVQLGKSLDQETPNTNFEQLSLQIMWTWLFLDYF